ncbi:hypothetical protein VTK73DRAFT_9360 [Phialemonium thermophilum]|uniref:Uncharacterized protein n=1 Tax=Phialemonium thermophilum TaxID=223376 RepID=A0ABR3XKE1_9PEZI
MFPLFIWYAFKRKVQLLNCSQAGGSKYYNLVNLGRGTFHGTTRSVVDDWGATGPLPVLRSSSGERSPLKYWVTLKLSAVQT